MPESGEVYHLKCGDFLRDLFRFYPVGVTNFIQREVSARTERQIIRPIIGYMLSECKEAESKEGFEACLVLSREDLGFRGPGYSKDFDEFLKALDDYACRAKSDFYEKHRL